METGNSKGDRVGSYEPKVETRSPVDPAGRRVEYSLFRDVNAQRAPEIIEVPVTAFAKKLETPNRAPTKTGLPLIVTATFGDQRSEKGSYRHRGNVLTITGAVGDYDAGQVSIVDARDRAEAAGIEAFFYTTPSHRPDRPRWRVVAFTSKSHVPGEYPRLVAKLNGALGGILTNESFTESQSFYFGRALDAVEYRTCESRGQPIDIADVEPIWKKPNGVNVAGGEAMPASTEEELRAAVTSHDTYHEPILRLVAKWAAMGDDEAAIREKLAALRAEAEPTVPADRTERFEQAFGEEADRAIAGALRKCGRESAAEAFADVPIPELPETEPPLRVARQHDVEPWSEPMDLFAATSLPQIQRSMLPDVIADLAFEAAATIGVDPAAPALSALAGLAALAPRRVLVRPRGHYGQEEQIIIWTMINGDPSAGKTPGIKVGTAAIRKLDAELIAASKDRRELWKLDSRLARREKTTEPPQPVHEQIIFTDTTVEALAKHMAQWGEHAVFGLYEEASEWIGRMDAYSERGSAKDKSVWIGGYDGGGKAINRAKPDAAGDTNWYIANFAVCLCVSGQPDVLAKLLPKVSGDGLIQRFNPVLLRPQLIGENRPPVLPNLLSLSRWLFDGVGLPDVLTFDGAAVTAFLQREQEVRLLAAATSASPAFAAYLGKMPGQVARYAGLYHLIQHHGQSVPDQIGLGTLERVLRLFDLYLVHAEHFYDQANEEARGRDSPKAMAHAAAMTILSNEWARFTPRDLGNYSRVFRDATEAAQEDVYRRLTMAGWVQEVAPMRGRRGRPPSALFIVNPAVHERFADRASEERARRRATGSILKNLQERARDNVDDLLA